MIKILPEPCIHIYMWMGQVLSERQNTKKSELKNMTSQKTQQKRDYEINKTVISCDAWHTDHDWSRHMARRPQQTPKTTSKQKP